MREVPLRSTSMHCSSAKGPPSEEHETLRQPHSLSHQEFSPVLRSVSQNKFIEVTVDLLRTDVGTRFMATGGSMEPTICDGEAITVEPVLASRVRRGDIVLYEMDNRVIAHRVVRIIKSAPIRLIQGFRNLSEKATGSSGKGCSVRPLAFVVRGDAFKMCDELVKAHQILGRVVCVERQGERIHLDNP